MRGINIFLADGFEDVEALGTNDVLVRGGLETTLVSVMDSPFVESSHGVCVGANAIFDEMEVCHEGTTADDFMVFPGGMPGSRNLAENVRLIEAMRSHYAAGGSVAAICAAPGLVLSQLGEAVWQGREFTCFDGFESYLEAVGGSFVPTAAVGALGVGSGEDGSVIANGATGECCAFGVDAKCPRVITGRSAGHCLSFGLAIVEAIKGVEVREKVANSLFLTTN